MPILNADMRDPGRPLAASEAQVAAVLKLHKASKSLRWIADETSLSLQTVRTIVGRKQRHRSHHGRGAARRSRSTSTSAHTGNHRSEPATHCPGVPLQVIETGNALVKEAKGLGRGR